MKKRKRKTIENRESESEREEEDVERSRRKRTTLSFSFGFLSFCSGNTLAKMRERIVGWKREVETNEEAFKNFYQFVFDYLRGEKKILRKKMRER
jgi:hypothetical protein